MALVPRLEEGDCGPVNGAVTSLGKSNKPILFISLQLHPSYDYLPYDSNIAENITFPKLQSGRFTNKVALSTK